MDKNFQFLQQAIKNFHNGNYALAKNQLINVLKLAPKTFDALHLMAIVLSKENDHQEALGYYKKAFKINPNNPEVLSNYAASLHQLHQDQ